MNPITRDHRYPTSLPRLTRSPATAAELHTRGTTLQFHRNRNSMSLGARTTSYTTKLGLTLALLLTGCAATPSSNTDPYCNVALSEINETKRLAEQQDTPAQVQLGLWQKHGHCVAQDHQSARRLFSKAAARRDAQGQYELGRLYLHGFGVPQNSERAVHWLRKAGEQGHVDAQRLLTDTRQGHPDDIDFVPPWRNTLDDLGTIAIAIPRFHAVIDVEGPDDRKNPVVRMASGTLKGTAAGAAVPAAVLIQTGAAGVVAAPVALGAVAVGTLLGTVGGLVTSVKDVLSERQTEKTAKELSAVLTGTDIQTGLQTELAALIRERSQHPVVLLDMPDSEPFSNADQLFAQTHADTVLQLPVFSAEMAEDTLSLHLSGQLWSRVTGTVIGAKDFDYSGLIPDDDPKRVVVDAFYALAEEIVSYLLDLESEIPDATDVSGVFNDILQPESVPEVLSSTYR